MADYIKREDALQAIESCAGWSRPLESAYEEIQAMPAADVAPVVHAHWENVGGNDKAGIASGTCSHCRQEAWANYELTPRCPYCGAHMDADK